MKRLLLAALLLALLPTPAHAAANFTVSCSYTRSLADDPLVFPNQPGASHLHDFYGNRTTDAFSTYDSMVGQPTSCGNSGDSAGYWTPALYNGTTKVNPTALKAYYYRRTTGTLTPFPAGLGMIAGDSHATGPQSTSRVYFGCGSGSGLSKVNYLPNCAGKGHLYVHISFPFCQNPTTQALAYGSCPSGYTIHFPQLVERISYPLVDARNATLSSGPYYTYHADFFNTWNQAEIQRLVATL